MIMCFCSYKNITLIGAGQGSVTPTPDGRCVEGGGDGRCLGGGLAWGGTGTIITVAVDCGGQAKLGIAMIARAGAHSTIRTLTLDGIAGTDRATEQTTWRNLVITGADGVTLSDVDVTDHSVTGIAIEFAVGIRLERVTIDRRSALHAQHTSRAQAAVSIQGVTDLRAVGTRIAAHDGGLVFGGGTSSVLLQHFRFDRRISLTRLLAHPPTHSFIHLFIHSHSLAARLLAHTLTHSFTHSSVHSPTDTGSTESISIAGPS